MEAKVSILEEVNARQRALLDERELIIEQQREVIGRLTRQVSAMKKSSS